MADARAPSSNIELRVLSASHTAVVRQTIGQNDLAATIGRVFQQMSETLARQGIKPDRAPFARYHSFGDTIDLEAGVPVEAPILADGEVGPGSLPAGPAAIAVHAGPYEGLGATYRAIEAWIASSGHTASGVPWEIYLTDPSLEPDPHRWLTEIIYPLQAS